MSTIQYQTISTLPVQEEMTEATHLVCEENGVTKRIPANAVGGAGGIKTAIIKSSDYDTIVGGGMLDENTEITVECLNMTFEEAYHMITSGEPLVAFIMGVDGVPFCDFSCVLYLTAEMGVPCLSVDGYYFWTADGLSFDAPGGK